MIKFRDKIVSRLGIRGYAVFLHARSRGRHEKWMGQKRMGVGGEKDVVAFICPFSFASDSSVHSTDLDFQNMTGANQPLT
jgi:hypothetical protein